MKLKKLVLSSLFIIAIFAGRLSYADVDVYAPSKPAGGATAYAEGLGVRMGYLETRINDLFTTTDAIKDTAKEQKSLLDMLDKIVSRTSVGAGLKTGFTAREDAAPNGNDWSKNMALDMMRFYVYGKVTEKISFRFNTEVFSNFMGSAAPGRFDVKDVRIMDAFAIIKLNDMFNFWVGHSLSAQDRQGLDGPFFLNTNDFPIVQAYPMHFVGQRDNGASMFGDIAGGKVRYAVSAYQGRQGGPNQEDHLIYSGRLTINFWEPDFGLDYWTTSAYYGEKDVLSLGLVFMHQQDGVGTKETARDFDGWNVDILLEKNLGYGVLNLEGAYYDFNLHGVNDFDISSFADPGDPFINPVEPGGAFFGGLRDGNSYFALASFMFPQKIGWGRIQPYTRYQGFNNHKGTGQFREGTTWERLEIGANYIMKGHDAKAALYWAHDVHNPGMPENSSQDFVKFALQLQFW